MNQAVKSINGVFRLEQLSGNETTAWAQWSFTSDHGYREGVGVYEVKNSLITYYRDYMNESSDTVMLLPSRISSPMTGPCFKVKQPRTTANIALK